MVTTDVVDLVEANSRIAALEERVRTLETELSKARCDGEIMGKRFNIMLGMAELLESVLEDAYLEVVSAESSKIEVYA